MKHKFIALFIVAAPILLAACQKSQVQNTSVPPTAKTYPLKGTVVSADKQNKTATIAGEAVPGYMEAMTMEFPIRDTWVWEYLTPGALIQADLVVNTAAKEEFWLEKIVISASPNPNQPAPTPPPARQIGQTVPAVKFTDQDGKRFSLADYRGKALALTFIYRECPLPNFCIRMSQFFSDATARISAEPEFRDKLKLLSISFDPARDTPDKLRQYGQGYMGNQAKPDFSVWRLAVGSEKEVRSIADFFGLQYEVDQNDKAVINHSLVTAVVGPDGRVKKVYTGNRWTVDELLQSLREAAG